MREFNWTQKRIADWRRKTFGIPENALNIITKIKEEVFELSSECEGIGFVSVDKVLEEAADVAICINQLVDNLGGNLQEEVNKKMEVNQDRIWIKTGDAIGRHK